MLLSLENAVISLITLLGFGEKRLVKKMYRHLQAEQPTWICSFSSYSSQPCTRKAVYGKIGRAGYLGERCRDEGLLSSPEDEGKLSAIPKKGQERRTGLRPCMRWEY